MTMTTTDANVVTITEMYEAFGKGDVANFLKYIDDGCDWDFAFPADHVIPWLQRGRGKAQAERFLMTAGKELEFLSFTIDAIATGPNLVVVLFSTECVVRATGKHVIETEEPHIWHFNDEGKVVRFRHAADTHQQWLALQP